MDTLPLDLLTLICDWNTGLDVARLRVVCKGTEEMPEAYVRRRFKERVYCFRSASTTIRTRWLRGKQYVSHVMIGDVTLKCHSRHGKSTQHVCRRMKDIIIPLSPGAFGFGDALDE